jgi:ferric-dicitrate binding protein FerR (iron transport regulator)
MTHRDATPSRGTSADRTTRDFGKALEDRTDRRLTEALENLNGQEPRDAPADQTERQLTEALEALAGGVLPAPDAYRTARGEWLRRERRRRLVLAVLIAVVFTLATLIGLWVLNQAPSDPGVIFSGVGGTAGATGVGMP